MKKKTIRNTLQIEVCIKAISKRLPGIKESEVPNYCYHVMAQDFREGIITSRIWDEIPKYQFADEEIDFPETRAILTEEADFETVVVGKNDESNNWAYLKRDGVSRAPYAHVTKLVLMYVRQKLEDEDKKPAISAARRDTTLDERLELLQQIMKLMMNYDDKTAAKLAKIRRIVEED